MTILAQSWGDNDKYFWRFTLAGDSANCWEIVLNSGDEDYPGCNLRFRGFKKTLIIALPPVLSPHREKVIANWDSATIARLGRNWYWDLTRRSYGIQIDGGSCILSYGAQTHDSLTDKAKCWLLPWANWRFISTKYYDPAGYFLREFKDKRRYSDQFAFKDTMPSCSFLFEDYDKEQITAKCLIEERMWKFGTDWCSWLSWFRKDRVVRSLDIAFSAEVGVKKGSWKGGTVGHGIDMQKGETAEDAFKRYCSKYNLTLLNNV